MIGYGWSVARVQVLWGTSQSSMTMLEQLALQKLFLRVAMLGLSELFCLLQALIAPFRKITSFVGLEVKMVACVVGYQMSHRCPITRGFQDLLSWDHTRTAASDTIHIDKRRGRVTKLVTKVGCVCVSSGSLGSWFQCIESYLEVYIVCIIKYFCTPFFRLKHAAASSQGDLIACSLLAFSASIFWSFVY